MRENQILPCVIWLTGLSGAGKTTMANFLHAYLEHQGHKSCVLDGDELRAGVNKDLGFDDVSRKENIRRTAEIAFLFYKKGFIVLVSLISPFREDREAARSLFPSGAFFEVFVDTDINICEQRDVKGLYKKARSNLLTFFSGIDSVYEAPQTPDIIIEGHNEDMIPTNANKVLQIINKKQFNANSLKVLIYGYGWNGKSMLEFLEDMNSLSKVSIEIYVHDEHFSPFIKDKRAIFNKEDIHINNFNFIFICMNNQSRAMSIKDSLLSQEAGGGVHLPAIRHIDNYFYSSKMKDIFTRHNEQYFIDIWNNDTFENTYFNAFIKNEYEKINDNIEYYEYYINKLLKHTLNNEMENQEENFIAHYTYQKNKYPMICVSYALGRCGTTVMTQWLSSLEIFGYFPNMLASYINTPIVGLKNYQLMKHFFSQQSCFESHFGVTQGMTGIMEFSALSLILGNRLTSDFSTYKNMNSLQLQKAKSFYIGFINTIHKPLITKSSAQEVYIFEQMFDDTLYIVLERDIYTHVLALVHLYKTLSPHLPGYSTYITPNICFENNPVLYAAITLKNAIIFRDMILSSIDNARKIIISYEEFCTNPCRLFEEICHKLKEQGHRIDDSYKGIDHFTVSPRKADGDIIAIVDEVFSNEKYNLF